MEKVIRMVVCDVCRSDRPAVTKITIDVCTSHRDSIQYGKKQRGHSTDAHDQAHTDNEELYRLIKGKPGHGRVEYARMLDWELNRVSRAQRRLAEKGLVNVNGHAQTATYWPVEMAS